MKTLLSTLALAAASLSSAALDLASATFTVSGTSGDWTLDFSMTNNIGVPMDLYFWGMNGSAIVSSPTDWSDYGAYNGFDTSWLLYANNPNTIQNGETLSGFISYSQAIDAPTTVDFFATFYDWAGNGQQTYNGDSNPTFQGTATVEAVPEPITLAVLGLGAIGVARRRRQA